MFVEKKTGISLALRNTNYHIFPTFLF